jgi:CDP-diacylglycerol--glycerol-3-phosphate 3-phosphatidyltransferase
MSAVKGIDQVTIIDRLLSRTFLRLLPKWVTPNHITNFRFLTIPFVILLTSIEQYEWGMLLFAVSAFSDALDGALARTTDQITDWGKMFDPLADKILIGTVAVILIPRFFSVWLAVIIVVIELFIILHAYHKKNYEGETLQAEKSGKAKMVFQSVGIGALFAYTIIPIPIFLVLAKDLLYLAVIFALIQIIVYRSI